MAGVILGVAAGAIAKGAAASAFITAVATAAGTALGAYLDQQFVYPALGLSPDIKDQEGPRIDDVSFQSASWGSPMRYCMGPKTRVAGTILWMSPVYEEAFTTSTGGKGGGGANITTYNYFVSFALGLCEGEISDLTKLIAEGRLLYDKSPNVSLAGTDITAYKGVTYRWYTCWPGWGYRRTWWTRNRRNQRTKRINRNELILRAPNGGTDLSLLKVGEDVSVTGFTNSVNNPTDKKVRATYKASDGSTWAFIDLGTPGWTTPGQYKPCGTQDTTPLPAISEAAGDSVTVVQNGLPTHDPKILTGGAPTLYKGTTTQNASALIEAGTTLGAGHVAAYRDTAYLTVHNLAVGPFGNRLPQMAALIEKDVSLTVGAAIGELLERAGLVGGDYDVSAVTDALKGYAIQGPKATAQLLRPLLQAFDLLVKEGDGKLVFFKRSTPITHTLDSQDDLGARPIGEDGARPVLLEDLATTRLPSEVNVTFFDEDEDMQKGTAKYRKTVHPGDHVVGIEYPITLNTDEGNALARERCWVTHANRKVVMTQLPPSYWHVSEGDTLLGVEVTDAGTGNVFVADIIVLNAQVGRNGIIRVRGVTEEQEQLA